MSTVDDAVERVLGEAEDEAAPSKMSQAEALEFYAALRERCAEWIENIRADMRAET